MADSHMTSLTRSELLVVYISLLAATVLVSLFKPQGLKKTILPFALPVVLIIVYGWFNPYFVKDPHHGRFNLALLGLKAASYSYKSPNYPDLINDIATRAKECRELSGEECERPSLRMFTFMEYMEKELEPENPPVTLSQMKD